MGGVWLGAGLWGESWGLVCVCALLLQTDLTHPLCCCFFHSTEDGAGGYQITLDFVKAMMQEFKEQRLIHRRFVFQIVLEVSMGGHNGPGLLTSGSIFAFSLRIS